MCASLCLHDCAVEPAPVACLLSLILRLVLRLVHTPVNWSIFDASFACDRLLNNRVQCGVSNPSWSASCSTAAAAARASRLFWLGRLFSFSSDGDFTRRRRLCLFLRHLRVKVVFKVKKVQVFALSCRFRRRLSTWSLLCWSRSLGRSFFRWRRLSRRFCWLWRWCGDSSRRFRASSSRWCFLFGRLLRWSRLYNRGRHARWGAAARAPCHCFEEKRNIIRTALWLLVNGKVHREEEKRLTPGHRRDQVPKQ